MGECASKGSRRWFYTGNQVGYLNHTGPYNACAGGPPGTGIAEGMTVLVDFPAPISRAPWENSGAKLTQEMLNACFPYINLNWICDIELGDTVFRVSDRAIYVEEENGPPRFYEARVSKAPTLNVTCGEWLAPNFEVGDVTLKLNNRDGAYNDWLPNGQYFQQWLSAQITIRVGFGEEFENYFQIFTGFVAPKQGVTSTDEELILKVFDRFDNDEVPLPVLFFNEINYPDIQDDVNGRGVPLVYGDWSVEVGDYGQVPAVCLNAKEEEATEYVFKISHNELSEIGDVYLHRGNRNQDNPDGPIRFLPSAVTKLPDQGIFTVSTVGEALAEYATVMEKTTSGVGSGIMLITSDTADTNFIEKGVKQGDLVIKTSTSEQAVVQSVSNNQLVLSVLPPYGNIDFTKGTEYGIRTVNYTFKKGDKITVKCVGKDISRVWKMRLADAGLEDAQPVGMTIGLDDSFWFADNSTQKIYQVAFKGAVKKEIPYSSINPLIANISGITIQTDNTIWLFEKNQSKVYRYDLSTDSVSTSFKTDYVTGMGFLLAGGVGLSIDAGNRLYLADNVTGNFYVINPFTPLNRPELLYSWNRSAFAAGATDINDLSADVNFGNLCVVDRTTQKLYRISPTTGALVSSLDLSVISPAATFVSGVSTHQDGTIFVLNRADNTVLNYNEFEDAKHNPGFIARDIIQSLTGKTAGDFDLSFNQTAREDLSQYRGRLFIDEKTNAVSAVSKFLQQFNTVLYAKFGKYALWQLNFQNFRNDGDLIREADIKQNSFKAAKEYNQYFNSAYTDYRKMPFSGSSTRSDTYSSPSGIAQAGREISRKLDMPSVYRRTDVDKLMPMFVRLSVPEPEFLTFVGGFRLLFTQLTQFYRIQYAEQPSAITGKMAGGRRFKNVPAFVRQITYDLETMTLQLKLWSLATTAFGDYVPEGTYFGGEGDKVVLTNLGTVGYIAPVAVVVDSGSDYIDTESVDGFDAEHRAAPIIGAAWKAGYRVAFVDAVTQAVAGHATILSVVGNRITFDSPIGFSVVSSSKNAAGFVVQGMMLRYPTYDEATAEQKADFAYFGPPYSSYPSNSATEADEQRAGLHNMPDNRIPYILFPKDYVPT